MRRKFYTPSSPLSDAERAEVFDEWLKNQREDVRFQAIAHVQSAMFLHFRNGETAAKSFVAQVYIGVREFDLIMQERHNRYATPR